MVNELNAQLRTRMQDQLISEVGLSDAREKDDFRDVVAPFLDKLIQSLNPGAKDDQKNFIDSSVKYIKSIYEAKVFTEKEERAQWIDSERKNFLSKSGVQDSSDLELEAFEKALELKSPPPLDNKAAAGEQAEGQAADGITGADSVDVSEAQADNSLTISSEVEFSKLKNETVQPLFTMLNEKKELIDEVLDIFSNSDFKGTEAKYGEITVKDMEQAKTEMADLVNAYDKTALINYLEKLDPKLQYAIGNYVKTTLGMMKDDFATVLKASLEDHLELPIKNAFNRKAMSLGATDKNEAPAATALKARYLLSAVLAVGDELEAMLKVNSNYQEVDKLVSEIFNEDVIKKIEEKVSEHHGVEVKINKHDILSLTKYLGNSNSGIGSSKETQKFDIMEFMKNNKKLVLGAVPMAIIPLAGVLSKLPFVGHIFAGAAGMVGKFAHELGPYMFSMFMGGDKQQTNNEQQVSNAEQLEQNQAKKADPSYSVPA